MSALDRSVKRWVHEFIFSVIFTKSLNQSSIKPCLMSLFRMNAFRFSVCRETKTKIITKVDHSEGKCPLSQWEPRQVNFPKCGETRSIKVPIGVSFPSHWLRQWRDNSRYSPSAFIHPVVSRDTWTGRASSPSNSNSLNCLMLHNATAACSLRMNMKADTSIWIKRNLTWKPFYWRWPGHDLGMSISEIQLIVSAIFKIIWF